MRIWFLSLFVFATAWILAPRCDAGDPVLFPTPDTLYAQIPTKKRTQLPSAPAQVYKERIVPHWSLDDSRFWYRNDLKAGTREFVLVKAETGERGLAFDHVKLASSLSKTTGHDYQADRLPFDAIEFVKGNKAIRFWIGDKQWTCDLESYACTDSATMSPRAVPPARKPDPMDDGPSPFWAGDLLPRTLPALFQNNRRSGEGRPVSSPNGEWRALVKDANVYIRSTEGKETPLTTDGKDGQAYGMMSWAPDSKTLVAFRIEPGDKKEVHLIESSPRDGGRAKLHSRPYPLPGDKFTAFEIHLFDAETGRVRKVDVDRIDFGTPQLRWNRDGHTFTYEKVDRGHQRYRLVEIDTHTGKSRNLIDEKAATFIWTAHTENLNVPTVSWLEKTDEIVYVSEKDGWRHLYMVDTKTGAIKNQITKGNYVVRGVDRIDAENRQVWFRASGMDPGQDPYFIHYYRIDFDGTGLVALTDGNGTHAVQYSPGRKYLVDSYSRIDMPPVHELRRVADGKKVAKLDEADISDLTATGWRAPEVFSAKGRDGETDIWGIICRPASFDPSKKYAVIESIYAGPQGSYTPKAFSAFRRFNNLTELGFVVVQMDGMGTANRSKGFHDVCWHNLKDAGFPDRIRWHRAAAAKYPFYDISRVGIYGTSAGGQNSTGALLFHGDFYSVAVSACGCHDNRMDKASWNEQWMGYPVGPQYAASSNIDNAHRLTGKLLLIVGEMDQNVPPESTYRLCDALIKAGKDFDFVLIPGLGHSNGGAYGTRRMQDFFVRHLQGVEPPDRNTPPRRTEEPRVVPTTEKSLTISAPPDS